MVQLIPKSEDFDQVLQQNKLVFVDFYADWCGPCRFIGPVIEKIEDELTVAGGEDGPGITFVKVNVDMSVDLATKYGIAAMPTFIMFKDGEPAEQIVGANEGNIRKVIQAFLSGKEEAANGEEEIEEPVEVVA